MAPFMVIRGRSVRIIFCAHNTLRCSPHSGGVKYESARQQQQQQQQRGTFRRGFTSSPENMRRFLGAIDIFFSRVANFSLPVDRVDRHMYFICGAILLTMLLVALSVHSGTEINQSQRRREKAAANPPPATAQAPTAQSLVRLADSLASGAGSLVTVPARVATTAEALRLSSGKDIRARVLLFYSLVQLGWWSEAYAVMKPLHLQDIYPDDALFPPSADDSPALYRCVAKAAIESGQLEDAIAIAERNVSLHTYSTPNILALCDALMQVSSSRPTASILLQYIASGKSIQLPDSTRCLIINDQGRLQAILQLAQLSLQPDVPVGSIKAWTAAVQMGAVPIANLPSAVTNKGQFSAGEHRFWEFLPPAMGHQVYGKNSLFNARARAWNYMSTGKSAKVYFASSEHQQEDTRLISRIAAEVSAMEPPPSEMNAALERGDATLFMSYALLPILRGEPLLRTRVFLAQQGVRLPPLSPAAPSPSSRTAFDLRQSLEKASSEVLGLTSSLLKAGLNGTGCDVELAYIRLMLSAIEEERRSRRSFWRLLRTSRS